VRPATIVTDLAGTRTRTLEQAASYLAYPFNAGLFLRMVKSHDRPREYPRLARRLDLKTPKTQQCYRHYNCERVCRRLFKLSEEVPLRSG